MKSTQEQALLDLVEKWDVFHKIHVGSTVLYFFAMFLNIALFIILLLKKKKSLIEWGVANLLLRDC